jgi:hypothetical protein
VSVVRKRKVHERKQHGIHYTPDALADFVAQRICEALAPDAANLSMLDPAIGDASLVLALLRRLKETGHRVDVAAGFDQAATAVTSARGRILDAFPSTALDLRVEDFLLSDVVTADDPTLFQEAASRKFDVVIANPPYVRTQVLGATYAQVLAQRFGLSGRVDLYSAFLVAIDHALKPGGIAGLIVSNRFMTTRAGTAVREFLLREFDVLEVYDFGDTRLFEAAVLPAVLVLRKKITREEQQPAKFAAIYSEPGASVARDEPDVFAALREKGVFSVPSGETFRVRLGQLSTDDSVWRLASDDDDRWLCTVAEHAALLFEDVGKVRVGIKTTADKIFIRDDWDQLPSNERPEVLQPLITHHVAGRYRASAPVKTCVLYTHTVENGVRTAIRLSRFPKTARYLERHRERLESREYVREAGREWFEIWVPHDPELWQQQKLVFRDIAVTPQFWLDETGAIVNGDCYWMTRHEGVSMDLLYLCLAVANSSLIEEFYDRRFHNKLYSGRRRWITQYVEKFPVPDATTPTARKLIALTRALCHDELDANEDGVEKEIDSLVWKCFGLEQKTAR